MASMAAPAPPSPHVRREATTATGDEGDDQKNEESKEEEEDASNEDPPPSATSVWVRHNFDVDDVIGSGTFGRVFAARSKKDSTARFALKQINRTALPRYVANEIRFLQRLGGYHNVIRLHAAHRELDQVFLVMDLFEHVQVKDVIESLTVCEILDYIKNLFISLKYLHMNGIIHRDIKPGNFLYNRETKSYRLVDFGLSEQADLALPKFGSSMNFDDHPADKENQGFCHIVRQFERSRPKRPLSAASSTSSNAVREPPTKISKLESHHHMKSMPIVVEETEEVSRPQEALGVATVSHPVAHPTPHPVAHPVPANSPKNRRQLFKISTLDDLPITQQQPATTPVPRVENAKKPTKNPLPNDQNSPCKCAGQPQSCAQCQRLPKKSVNKAGTAGFRAPEILLRLSDQSTLVDVWAAGITLLSLMCRVAPVMRPTNELDALLQIAALVGSRALEETASDHGVRLHLKPTLPGLDLVKFVALTSTPMDSVEQTFAAPTNCTVCKTMLSDNERGVCVCKSSESASLARLDENDPMRLAHDVLAACLICDPRKRLDSALVLGLFGD